MPLTTPMLAGLDPHASLGSPHHMCVLCRDALPALTDHCWLLFASLLEGFSNPQQFGSLVHMPLQRSAPQLFLCTSCRPVSLFTWVPKLAETPCCARARWLTQSECAGSLCSLCVTRQGTHLLSEATRVVSGPPCTRRYLAPFTWPPRPAPASSSATVEPPRIQHKSQERGRRGGSSRGNLSF